MQIKINRSYLDPAYRELLNATQRDIISYGGGGSGKSHSLMLLSVMWALEGRSVLIIRKVAATLSDSCWAEILNAIDNAGVRDMFDITPYKKLIISNVSAGSIMMRGLDNAEKIKSVRSPGMHGIDTILVEEATELSADDIYQLRLRQRGYTPFPKRFIMLFNPIVKTHHIFQNFFEATGWDDHTHRYEDEEKLIIKTTYKDNTHLMQDDIDTLENYKYTCPYHYNVYCLGNWGILGDLIYDRVEYLDSAPILDRGYGWRVGIDSGWNDLQTCVLSKTDGKHIHIVDAIGYSQMPIDIFADKVRHMFGKNGVPENQLIIADSSHPRDNAALRQQGLNVKRAIKGGGSKFAGLMFLKSKKISVCTSLKDFVDALQSYTWKKDKNGVSLDETNHEGSDYTDALRYSYEIDLKSKGTSFGDK